LKAQLPELGIGLIKCKLMAIEAALERRQEQLDATHMKNMKTVARFEIKRGAVGLQGNK